MAPTPPTHPTDTLTTVAKPLTDQERDEIIGLIRAGHSRNEVARLSKRGTTTITRIAAEIGHDWLTAADERTQSSLSRAHEARSAYCAGRRAAIAERLVEEVDLLLDGLHGEYLVYNFGGKDNTYEEHQLDEPPTDVKRAIMQSVRDAMRTVIEIDRHDATTDEGKAKGLLERLFDGLSAAAES